MKWIFAVMAVFIVLVAIIKAREILREKRKREEWLRRRRTEREEGKERWREMCEEWERKKGAGGGKE